MDWTILPLRQSFRKKQYQLIHIIFWSKFSKNTTWVELYCLYLKIFLKGNMGWTLLSFGQRFLKTLYVLKKIGQYGLNGIVICSKLTYHTIWIELFDLLIKFGVKTTSIEPHFLFIKISLKDNMDQTLLSFGQNSLRRQHGLKYIAFSSKLAIRTTWVDQYGLLNKYFQKHYTDWNALSFHHNFLKRQYGINCISFAQNILKRQRGLSHICFWPKVSKKTRWVRPYCLLVKIFLKDYMGWMILSFGINFWKEKYWLKDIIFYS